MLPACSQSSSTDGDAGGASGDSGTSASQSSQSSQASQSGDSSQSPQSGERLDSTYDPNAGYRHISGDKAAQLMETEDCVVVDVRGQVDWDYMHIPGSIPISFDVITTEEGQAQLPDKDQMIILYCDYGGLSKIAAEDTVSAGYTNIVEFDASRFGTAP